MFSANGVKYFENKQIVVGLIDTAQESVPAAVDPSTPLWFMSADNYGILVLVGAKDATDKTAPVLFIPWAVISGITAYGTSTTKKQVA